jgi:hypothetical protein
VSSLLPYRPQVDPPRALSLKRSRRACGKSAYAGSMSNAMHTLYTTFHSPHVDRAGVGLRSPSTMSTLGHTGLAGCGAWARGASQRVQLKVKLQSRLNFSPTSIVSIRTASIVVASRTRPPHTMRRELAPFEAERVGTGPGRGQPETPSTTRAGEPSTSLFFPTL